mgnify:CR=1 FL=1
MPLNKFAMARYKAIDERLQRKDYPSLEALVAYVSEKLDRPIAVRTIQKDLYDMRNSMDLNFNAPIKYDHYRRGYYYDPSDYSIDRLPVTQYDLDGLEIAINILEHFKNIPLIRQFEDAIGRIAGAVKISKERLNKAQGILHIDQSVEYAGSSWIAALAEAIVQRKWVRIRHRSYQRNEAREYRLAPYHIREYQHRFYVIGESKRRDETQSKIRIFGLDRIQNIWTTRDTFEYPETFDHQAFFGNIIGISDPEKEPENIELWFEAEQSKYILSQPIHASQRVLEQTDAGCRIGLKVVINYELLMLLLSYGSHVKVLSPAHLARQIQQEARKMVALYDNK